MKRPDCQVPIHWVQVELGLAHHQEQQTIGLAGRRVYLPGNGKTLQYIYRR